MQRNPWRLEQGGVHTLDIGVLHLVVMQASGQVRFMVLRRPTGAGAGPEMLLGSGTEDSVQSAMAAAERMAARCSCHVYEAHAWAGELDGRA